MAAESISELFVLFASPLQSTFDQIEQAVTAVLYSMCKAKRRCFILDRADCALPIYVNQEDLSWRPRYVVGKLITFVFLSSMFKDRCCCLTAAG